MDKIITLTGCSSCGKDTILNALLRIYPKLKNIISHTNRPTRNGEKQNVSYHFVTYEDMIKGIKNNEFIENRRYCVIGKNGYEKEEWIYGIHKNELKKDGIGIVIVDYEGLTKLQKYCYEQDIEYKSYYIDCEPSIRLRRALNREPNTDRVKVMDMCRRLLDDEENVIQAKTSSVTDCIVLKNNTKKDFINCILTISKEIEGN